MDYIVRVDRFTRQESDNQYSTDTQRTCPAAAIPFKVIARTRGTEKAHLEAHLARIIIATYEYASSLLSKEHEKLRLFA
jgi:hypothetical protein